MDGLNHRSGAVGQENHECPQAPPANDRNGWKATLVQWRSCDHLFGGKSTPLSFHESPCRLKTSPLFGCCLLATRNSEKPRRTITGSSGTRSAEAAFGAALICA